MKKGVIYALATYILWGLFPIYWKWLDHIPAPQLIGHRITWSFVLLLIVLITSRQWVKFRTIVSNRKILVIYSAAALLLGTNWLTYVWAVNAGFIVEASLGYFINPLLSVLLGMVFLGEKLRPWQWLAVGLAAAGVLYMTLAYGRLPWIALTLALTFGIYGLVTKVAPLNSLYGLTLETGLMFIPALVYLALANLRGEGAFLHTGLTSDLLMVGAGVVTAIPLLMFGAAAQRIPLTMIGIMQYIAPTLQFLLGVLVYEEPFPVSRLIGFGLVWVALIIFWAEGAMTHRVNRISFEVP